MGSVCRREHSPEQVHVLRLGGPKKAGYEQLAAIFEETAGNEKEHAKLWFKLLCGGAIPDTLTCLDMAASGEHDEWTEMYPPAWPRRPRKRVSPAGCIVHHGGPDRERARRALPRVGRQPEEQQGCSPAKSSSCGSAGTAATPSSASRLRSSARCAHTPRATLS